jgi:hypothetical protein
MPTYDREILKKRFPFSDVAFFDESGFKASDIINSPDTSPTVKLIELLRLSLFAIVYGTTCKEIKHTEYPEFHRYGENFDKLFKLHSFESKILKSIKQVESDIAGVENSERLNHLKRMMESSSQWPAARYQHEIHYYSHLYAAYSFKQFLESLKIIQRVKAYKVSSDEELKYKQDNINKECANHTSMARKHAKTLEQDYNYIRESSLKINNEINMVSDEIKSLEIKNNDLLETLQDLSESIENNVDKDRERSKRFERLKEALGNKLEI